MQFINAAFLKLNVKDQHRTAEATLAALSRELLSREQISAILGHPTQFPSKLIEELSIATALKYWNGQMTYHDGDCIMNNFFIFWTTNPSFDKSDELSETAWECYLAFDSGEFYRQDDDRSVDPAEKYTKPLIEELLKKRNLIH